MYNLLELAVWGRRSRTWRRWIYGNHIKQKRRRELRELAWLFTTDGRIGKAYKGETYGMCDM